ncbi:MAG TPA: phytoene/squalene synthase family protein [Candidatus Sulfotelmatobacter sp.]|nr:phytoene/squalene synthase family protein [Candidatus Sulfotelmatobacter sp.]
MAALESEPVLEDALVQPPLSVTRRGRAMRRADRRACRRVITAHARSFAFASLFLPRDVREDVDVVYAYFRLLDDLVDETPVGVSTEEVRAALEDWDGWLRRSAPREEGDVIRRCLPEVISRRGLDWEALRVVIRGLQADLDHVRPRTLVELERYAFEVAGSVGLVMAVLLGARLSDAARPAAALGSAMQLTNVCRDVDEDLRRGRIYLPVDVCQAMGCDDEALWRREATPGVRAAVAAVAERAQQLYSEGLGGLELLPENVRFPICVATRSYAAILDGLAAREYDVFSGRVAVGARSRWAMAARLAASRLAHRDAA